MVNGSKQLNKWPGKLLLSSPRGFCAGVKRAIDALNQAVESYPNQTIYCYHQIVHNFYIVKEFEKKGVKFINLIEEAPNGSIVVFSSHGVSPALKQQAISQKLLTIDATCPFVTKTHMEVKKYAAEGDKIIYIGQPDHDETIGTVGEAPENTVIIQKAEEIKNLPLPPTSPIALITQTTLSCDETESLKISLRERFPKIIEPLKSDICQATQNRQNGVKELVKQGAEVIIVLGSANSSNSNKLKKVAEKAGARAVLLDDITEIDESILSKISTVGLTAGASLPEYKITEAITWFKNHGTKEVREVFIADESKVALPRVDIN